MNTDTPWTVSREDGSYRRSLDAFDERSAASEWAAWYCARTAEYPNELVCSVWCDDEFVGDFDVLITSMPVFDAVPRTALAKAKQTGETE